MTKMHIPDIDELCWRVIDEIRYLCKVIAIEDGSFSILYLEDDSVEAGLPFGTDEVRFSYEENLREFDSSYTITNSDGDFDRGFSSDFASREHEVPDADAVREDYQSFQIKEINEELKNCEIDLGYSTKRESTSDSPSVPAVQNISFLASTRLQSILKANAIVLPEANQLAQSCEQPESLFFDDSLVSLRVILMRLKTIDTEGVVTMTFSDKKRLTDLGDVLYQHLERTIAAVEAVSQMIPVSSESKSGGTFVPTGSMYHRRNISFPSLSHSALRHGCAALYPRRVFVKTLGVYDFCKHVLGALTETIERRKTLLSKTTDFRPFAGFCAVCHASTRFRCHRCSVVYYCSRSCQRSDWSRHSVLCRFVPFKAVSLHPVYHATATSLPDGSGCSFLRGNSPITSATKASTSAPSSSVHINSTSVKPFTNAAHETLFDNHRRTTGSYIVGGGFDINTTSESSNCNSFDNSRQQRPLFEDDDESPTGNDDIPDLIDASSCSGLSTHAAWTTEPNSSEVNVDASSAWAADVPLTSEQEEKVALLAEMFAVTAEKATEALKWAMFDADVAAEWLLSNGPVGGSLPASSAIGPANDPATVYPSVDGAILPYPNDIPVRKPKNAFGLDYDYYGQLNNVD